MRRSGQLLTIIYCFAFIFIAQETSAQELSFYKKQKSDIYKINPWVSSALGIGGFVSSELGLKRIGNKEPLSLMELNALNTIDVVPFNRNIFEKNSNRREEVAKLSDVILRSGLFTPFLLMLDKKIRKNWLDVSLLYLETQMIGVNYYAWGAPQFIDKYRPVAYLTDVPIDERMEQNNRNSFFSGHVSSTATSFFFMAKVYTDYHPEINFLGKVGVYSAASVTPILMSHLRIRAFKHFRTDTYMGFLVGALNGILVPAIHKRKSKLKASVFINQLGQGISLSWNITK